MTLVERIKAAEGAKVQPDRNRSAKNIPHWEVVILEGGKWVSVFSSHLMSECQAVVDKAKK
jgi:hypothetical protein